MNSLTHLRHARKWLFHSRRRAAAIAQTIVARFALAAINLATGVITARALNADGRGIQSALLLWPALLCYLLTLGIPSAVLYCIRKEPAKRDALFTTSLVIAFAMSGVAVVAGNLFIPHWLHQYPPQVVREAQLLMFFAPEIMSGLILTAMLESLGEFSRSNATRLIPTLTTLAALLVLRFTNVLTPFTSALAYLVPPVFAALWNAAILRRYFVRRLFDLRPLMRVLGWYGIRSYGIDILATLSTQVDQVLVVAFLPAPEMGIYAVSLAASRVLQILSTAVATVLFPTASGKTLDEVIPMVGQSARVSFAIAVFFATALILSAPFIIPFFYGSAFRPAVPIAQLLAVEAVLGGLVYVVSQTFMAVDRPGLVTILQGFGLAIAIPSMVVLLPRFGLIGAAAALLISTSARFVFLAAAYPIVLKRPFPNIVPSFGDLTALAATVRES